MIRIPTAAEYAQLTFNEKRIVLARLRELRLSWLATETTQGGAL